MKALDVRNPKKNVFPTAETRSVHDSVRVKIRLKLDLVNRFTSSIFRPYFW